MVDFNQEVENDPQYESIKFHDAINKERQCEGFVKWSQGFTPKEHQDMLDRQWKVEYERRRDQEDREWRDRKDKEDRRWKVLELIVMGGIVTLVSVIAQLVAAYIARG